MDMSSNERQPSVFLLHNYAADRSQGSRRSYNSKRIRSPTGVSPYQPPKYLSLEDTKIIRTVPRWSNEEKKWLQTFVNQNENERQQMTPDTFWNFVSNKFTENFQISRTGSSCKKTYQRLFFHDDIQMHSNKTTGTGTQTDSSCISSTSCELDQSSSIDHKNEIICAIENDDIDTVVDLIYKNPTLKALLWTKYTSDIDLTVEANKTIQPIAFTPEDKPDVQKSSRRSLIFSDENHLIGEIQVIIHHPSGKRVKSVTSETYKTVCRSIVRDADNTDKTIIESLVASNPKEVVNGCSKIIEKECQQISKAALDTLLRKKNHNDFFDFNWEHLHTELNKFCPGLLYILKTASGKKTTDVSSKYMRHVFLSAALLLHGRNQEINFLQFVIGFILSCGGCTLRTIERLCNMGLSVHPVTIHKKLESWQDDLDSHVQSTKTAWENGISGITKYQLVGDNWDRNILPSYRTSQQKTLSLHLFNLIAVEDRFTPNVDENVIINVKQPEDIELTTFIPSVQEQTKLMEEFTFLYATSLIENHPQLNASMKNIYPTHLHHPYSHCAGIKTSQYPLGLFDCNETKTQEVIQLLKQLTNKYVPVKDGELIESVFFGGDRLTDERVQCAQAAMANSTSAKDRLEGFISKIEDFHRLMNFLEAICKLTYSTHSGHERGTAYYYRNLLNLRNVKAEVRNSYRAYKMLYYIILDALFMVLFLQHFNLKNIEDDILLPDEFDGYDKQNKIKWLNDVCSSILSTSFFDGKLDMFEGVRQIFEDAEHKENYWISNLKDGRVKCHFCEQNYAFVGSLKYHEKKCHGVNIETTKHTTTKDKQSSINDYLTVLFKLTLFHKNLDSAVDMGDGERSVRSAKYEIPIYNKTNKLKYLIGSVHLISLTSGMLPPDQTERLISNRFINLQGGKNNNMALDEYVEMVNRDSKTACKGHQTKESILLHSKEYPHLNNVTKHFDVISETHTKKGFHHLPSYKEDVRKVTNDLMELRAFEQASNSIKLNTKGLFTEKSLFDSSVTGLSTLIHRHRPQMPFHRLRDPNI